MSNASRPFRLRVLRGEARIQGRRFESLCADLRRAGLAVLAGRSSSGCVRLTVVVRARFTADGIRSLYFMKQGEGREGSPGLEVAALSSALARASRVARPTPRDIERWILTEGNVLGTAELEFETNGAALRVAPFVDGEPLAVGAMLRLEFGGAPPLTAGVGPIGASFAAAAVVLRDHPLTRVGATFEGLGELRFEDPGRAVSKVHSRPPLA